MYMYTGVRLKSLHQRKAGLGKNVASISMQVTLVFRSPIAGLRRAIGQASSEAICGALLFFLSTCSFRDQLPDSVRQRLIVFQRVVVLRRDAHP